MAISGFSGFSGFSGWSGFSGMSAQDQSIGIDTIIGLQQALDDKLETSLLKTTLAGDLDTDIPSVKAVNAALDGKADILTAYKTVNIPFGSTAAEIQALIDAEPKYLNNRILTFVFEDCPHKYFNGTTDKIVGDGTTATVTHAAHGFENGWLINFGIVKEVFFSGSTDIVGNGATATVTRNSHGFKDGDYVKIIGTINFDGTYEISSVTANTFVISHAYSGTETPPNTASLESIEFSNSYDPDYTITVIDENTYTFSSTVVGQITPSTTGIARRVWDLGSGSIQFRGFYGGNMDIRGNTSESSATVAHINQRVYLKTTANHCIQVQQASAQVVIDNIKAKGNRYGLYILDCTNSYIRYSYLLGIVANYGAINIGVANAQLRLNICNGNNTTSAIRVCENANVISYGNRTYRRSTVYGYRCDSAVIRLGTGNTVSGSTALNLTINGGQVL